MTTRWNLPLDTITRSISRLRPDELNPMDAFACAAWSFIAEPGDRIAGELIGALGESAALDLVVDRASARHLSAITHDAITVSEAHEATQRWEGRLDSVALMRSLDRAADNAVRIVIPTDSYWPVGVNDLGPHRPRALWVRGDVSALPQPHRSVAIVGARASTGYGEHVAMDFSAGIAQRGFTVVSGGAYGIDGMAHRAAIAVAGTTVAVLAGGVDQLYPSGHDELLRTVMGFGAVISEVPCGGAPTRWRFLQRNRIIAALAGATVVIEAGHRSGSLNTATHARDLGRPVGVVPGQITSAASAGCHRLLRTNTAAVAVTNVPEILELITGESENMVFSERDSAETIRVLDALTRRSYRTVGDIALRTGLAVVQITSTLGQLSLDARVESLDAGWRKT
jgi:DNA processing protein